MCTSKDERGPRHPEGVRRPRPSLDVFLRDQAITRAGSSTIEKPTPALWRCSSETSRQQSSASLRVVNGPLTCAEPSTSLWKFIEPNSPPITQKLLPLLIVSLLLLVRDQSGIRPNPGSIDLTVSRTGSSCYGRRPPSGQLRRRSTPCDRRRCWSRPCSDASRRRCPDGSQRAGRSSRSRACPVRRNIPSPDCRSRAPPCDRSAT